MKTDTLTGISYPEAEDDYTIFEDFVQNLMRYNYFNMLKQSILPNGLDATNITHDTGDFFNFAISESVSNPFRLKLLQSVSQE